MAVGLRVRFENGVFVPLDDVSAFEEGNEYRVVRPAPADAGSLAAFQTLLAELRQRAEPLPDYTPEKRAQLLADLEQSAGIFPAEEEEQLRQILAEDKAREIEAEQKLWNQ